MKIIKLSDNREMVSAAAEWFSSIEPILRKLNDILAQGSGILIQLTGLSKETDGEEDLQRYGTTL